MLKILIVEDDELMAKTLQHLVELNPLHSVTAVANDYLSAIEAVARQTPDLALVDLQLANSSSGFSVAAKLHELGVECLLTTGKAPSFPVPDLAIGCLSKPFREADLVRALSEAEDILRRRERFIRVQNLPDQLQLYPRDEVQSRLMMLGSKVRQEDASDDQDAPVSQSGIKRLLQRFWRTADNPNALAAHS
jgi:CheY-like chemotaxis protein